ncbi:MAG: hypothetical protein EA001_13270 [Oscillatoriales cyanobacterium]|nr:MAG: hypothetical protein EA001_13270 [Oscillatoriales cyanobacterium]
MGKVRQHGETADERVSKYYPRTTGVGFQNRGTHDRGATYEELPRLDDRQFLELTGVFGKTLLVNASELINSD